ncbi:replication-relaxation family protein [Rubinisphaera italica]|uniref:Replication-relaxation n=1 Tax=Rubinisphaera italica TaxID=2527969 RepID=A0A5C5XD23_9PLAN|nr:replication-relaxation family protein [Rubinisphaera italica]TWT60986.1 hypothetical protein Pan54_17180 [Rubinisphaera italica]
MAKRSETKIGPRDNQILMALDRCPLTVSQLMKLSATFESRFTDPSNLRRRLRALSKCGFIKSWRYGFATDGQPPKYFKLSREGFRFLYDDSVALPRRRYFEEIRLGHHQHTHALAELIVHVICQADREGIRVVQYARENSVRIDAAGFTLYPDCAFQLVDAFGGKFNFVVELDNATERIRTTKDTESIERKIRGYDAHQYQFRANDSHRYLVLFITTRSKSRLERILSLAGEIMANPARTVFVGGDLFEVIRSNPFADAVFQDHRGLKRMMIPRTRESSTSRCIRQPKPTQSNVQPAFAKSA